MNTINTSQLRNFVQPPPEVQKTIEEVAALVAERGSAIEFQLRAGKKDQHRYSFLYLDNEYAAFYQYKLGEARLRKKASNGTAEAEKLDEASSPPLMCGSITNSPLHTHRIDDIHPSEFHEPGLVHDYAYGDIYREFSTAPSSNTYDLNSAEDTTGIIHTPRVGCIGTNSGFPPEPGASISNLKQSLGAHQLPESAHYKNHAPEFQSDSLNDFAHINSIDPLLTKPQGVIPYGPLDEVHLLDSNGTERSGLNTFVVVSNSDSAEPNNLYEYLKRPTESVFDREPVYRVRPSTDATFRVSHHRLVRVGYNLGAEVKFLANNEKGVVVKRKVENRQRVYDVKGTDGIVKMDVPEEMLEVHGGETFDFRMPPTF